MPWLLALCVPCYYTFVLMPAQVLVLVLESQKSLTTTLEYADHNIISNTYNSFYLAMHFSAKRGRAIACRLSVCLSAALVDCDHIGWNSSKLISPESIDRNHHRSFEWCNRWPLRPPLPPQNGVPYASQHTRMAISQQRVIRYTSCLVE